MNSKVMWHKTVAMLKELNDKLYKLQVIIKIVILWNLHNIIDMCDTNMLFSFYETVYEKTEVVITW